MEPEIARRCLSCGASVRGRAHFCPQCGQPMGEGAAEAREAALAQAAAQPLSDEAERVAASLSGRLADAPATEPESQPDNSARILALGVEPARPTEDAARPSVVTPEATAGEAREAAAARGRVRGRAAAVGASVGESLKPRVERLREASSVVIDEATDDPGVRFIVIAAVLFLLFLLLWLLSFTLG